MLGRRILVTGGAGFIGSAVVRMIVNETPHHVLVADNLSYAGSLASLAPVAKDERYEFSKSDIRDAGAMRALFERFQPDLVMHLAAETPVDRSIDEPAAFADTNVIGTFTLLKTALDYWRNSKNETRGPCRRARSATGPTADRLKCRRRDEPRRSRGRRRRNATLGRRYG